MALFPLLSAALIALSVQGPIEAPVTAEEVAPAPIVMAAPAWLEASTSCDASAPVADWRQGFSYNCPAPTQYCSYRWDKFNWCCVPTYIAPGAFCPVICL